MYPQGGFRNPYSIYGIGDRSQTGRQPSRLGVPISQPQPQPQPQQQQQQIPKPEATEEEPPKRAQPARQPSKTEAQVPKQAEPKQDQQKVAREPKTEPPTPTPPASFKYPSPQSVAEAADNKNEKLRIVPADQGKATVKGSTPEPEKSLQQGIKEDMTNLTRKLTELHAQHKLLNADQKPPGQADTGVGVITLAGENRGATMDLGPDSRKNGSFGFQGRGQKVGQDAKNEEQQDAKGKGSHHSSKAGPVKAYVNSNVQAANNSILYNSTCPHRDPGVRLALSNNPVHAKEITPPSKETHPKATKKSAP